VDNDDLSIHFGMEINWESSTRITVDMDSIEHLLWSDSRITLNVRLTDSDYNPVSDWSPDFNLADDDAACSMPNVKSVNTSPPYCVLRNSPSAYARLLELTGENFPSTDYHLQFRQADSGDVSINFSMEVNWESPTRISVDMDKIKHLLWSGSHITLTVRLTDSDYEPASNWSPEFYLADDDNACNAVDNGWAVFRDTVYGYTIQHPASWYVYPTDGTPGSVSTLSGIDQKTDALTNSVQIQIGLAIYERDLDVSLRDWVSLSDHISSYVTVSPGRPALFTDELLIQSYDSLESSFRRAYVARGQKVYIIDLIPDDPSKYTLFTSILQSLAFTDPIHRDQAVKSRLFGGGSDNYRIHLPLIIRSSTRPATYSLAKEILAPQNVPSNVLI